MTADTQSKPAQDALRGMMDDDGAGAPSAAEIQALVRGERTWAELLGLSAEECYVFADLGWNLLEQGKLDEAAKVVRGLVVANPWDGRLHNLLGCVLSRRGQYADALRELSLAIDLDAKDLQARVNRAELHLRMGRFPKAAADLKAAVALDPKGEKPAGVRARMLARATARIFDEAHKQLAAHRQ